MLTRRQLLSSLIAASAGTALMPKVALAEAVLGTKKSTALPWKNWSGSQLCYPQQRLAPKSVPELQEVVQSATGVIRAVGAGHSFSPLVPTDETIVSLGRLTGVVHADPTTTQATLWAGTRLGDIGGQLHKEGQAMINMPDIDEQTLAGAISTATHGTGAGIGALSTFVEEIEMVTANGDILVLNKEKNADMLAAARVSLGNLGLITKVKLQNQKGYNLKRQTIWQPIEDILANADVMADSNRNYEFFYIPFSRMGFSEISNITEEPASIKEERLDGNEGVETLRTVRDLLQWSTGLREGVLKTAIGLEKDEVFVGPSHQSFANERNSRFNEMEYHLPREYGIKAFKEIIDVLESQHKEVFFPMECRFVKGDDDWLSPFYKRDSFSIAVHRIHDEEYKPFFKTIEAIFKKYHGRPHWGKINTLTAQDFEEKYERWNDFKDIRNQLDPNGRFLNPYMKSLFLKA